MSGRDRQNTKLHGLSHSRTMAMQGTQTLAAVSCQVNTSGLYHLIQDEPGKRRKVYLEFSPGTKGQPLEDLAQAGFDMESIRQPHRIAHKQDVFSCLVIGTSETILRFLQYNQQVRLASIDLPEYSWLSAATENTSIGKEHELMTS